jgi:predicted Zn-dependent peptidase
MINVPKWFFYGLVVVAIAACLGVSALVATRKKKSMQPVISSVDSLVLQQFKTNVARLQTRIDQLEEQDSLLKVIDAKLALKMTTNEVDLRKNIDRVRQLNSADHSRELSKNISESLSYRRRYYHMHDQPPDSTD